MVASPLWKPVWAFFQIFLLLTLIVLLQSYAQRETQALLYDLRIIVASRVECV